MARIKKVKESKRSMWESVADKLGDFLEENLWGMDEQYFQDKYGDDWESKYESTRKNVRSLYGLIPQTSGRAKTDATVLALAGLIGRPIGIQAVRGIRRSLEKSIRGGQVRGGAQYEGSVYISESPLIGSGYMESMQMGKVAEKHVAGVGYAPDAFFNLPAKGEGSLVVFDLPKSFMDMWARGGSMWREGGRFGGRWSGGRLIKGAREIEMTRPIPEEFIQDVIPAEDIVRKYLPELGWGY